MKLRMKKNSIRLRLTQSEIKTLSDLGHVSETIDFGTGFGDGFTYVLRVDPDEKTVMAIAGSGIITVVLPRSMAESWIETDLIGLEAEQTVGGGDELRLIIEKDFACLNPRPGENQSDSFPNPNKDSLC